MIAHPLWVLAHSSFALLFQQEKRGWSFFCVRAIEMRAPPQNCPPFSWSALNGTRSLLNKQRALARKGVGGVGSSRHMVDQLISASPFSCPPSPQTLSSPLIQHTGGHHSSAKTTSCLYAFTQLPLVQPFPLLPLYSCRFFVFVVYEHKVFSDCQ